MTTPTYSQNQRLADYLRNHPGGITQDEAKKELGIWRLASRIDEIKAEVHIADVWEAVRDRYGKTCRVKRYFLAKSERDIFGQLVDDKIEALIQNGDEVIQKYPDGHVERDKWEIQKKEMRKNKK